MLHQHPSRGWVSYHHVWLSTTSPPIGSAKPSFFLIPSRENQICNILFSDRGDAPWNILRRQFGSGCLGKPHPLPESAISWALPDRLSVVG